MNLSPGLQQLILAGLTDLLQASEVASIIQDAVPRKTTEERGRVFLATVREGLEAGLIEVGEAAGVGSDPIYKFSGTEFHPWRLPTDAILEKLKDGWETFNGSFMVGEFCWIRNTSTGSRIARGLRGDGE